MLLTLGFAHRDDFPGAWQTIQNFHFFHPPDLRQQCQLLAVDNNPASEHGRMLRELLAKVEGGFGAVDYLRMEKQGTAAPRDLIFREAKGKYVACMDCHIFLVPGGLQKLADYYAAHPETSDLLTGPLIYDNGYHATHFHDMWRGEMWGIWAQAWTCRCGDASLTPMRTPNGRTHYIATMTRDEEVSGCGKCGARTPSCQWEGHEGPLLAAGFRPMIAKGEPFEIPAQGLGFFSCRKDAWPGFNPHFAGFGGEEFYLHEKFRQRGGKALCLPGVGWVHRFGRPDGVPYEVRVWDKARNYVIGHTELGLPLDRIRKHFVEGIGEDGQPVRMGPDGKGYPLLTEKQWAALTATPDNPPLDPPDQPKQRCGTCGGAPVPDSLTLEDLYQKAAATHSDINEHCAKLRDLATGADTVVEFGMRPQVSTVAILAGQPKRFITFETKPSRMSADLKSRQGSTEFDTQGGDSLSASIPECDGLFLDTVHTGEHVFKELERHAGQVRKWIAFHDTEIFGQRGEDGTPGLGHGIQRFMEAHSEWRLVYHADSNNGFTVISKEPVGHGPGTELKALLGELGVKPSPTCDCNARAEQMDLWGVAGCREHREEILGWLRGGQAKWGWKEKLSAAAKAVVSGLAFKLNPLDPYPGLVDEAIRRAEERTVPA